MTVGQVTEQIMAGHFNPDELQAIQQAIKFREDVNQRAVKNSLKIGDSVWFNDKTSPKYLQGQELTVKQVNRERLVCEFKNKGAGGRRFGDTLRGVPISIITTTKPTYAVPVHQTERPTTDRYMETITPKDVGPLPKELANEQGE